MSLDALQDLFARVRDGETGVWRLGQDPQRTIFIEKGQVVFAQSTHPLDRLTHLLVEKGKLTQAQMDYAMENLAPGLSIGRNLIQMGFITQRDLLDVAKFQVERVVSGVLGSEGTPAEFEARELDTSVVRLALDTPGMMLGGLLNLRDRERMLGLLGPLDQVLELLTPPPEASLPSDLVKAPPLFDGLRTLLDLSREAGIEPMRLGALALFLKEMQWARPVAAAPAPVAWEPGIDLFEEASEIPVVVDAPGLEITLALGAPPTSPQPAFAASPQPASAMEPRPASLIEHIQAAALPTANLEHMAEQLDTLPPPMQVQIEPMIPVEPAMRAAGGDPPSSPPQASPTPPLDPFISAWIHIPPATRNEDEITAENLSPIRLPETHGDGTWRVEEGQALLPEPTGQVAFAEDTEDTEDAGAQVLLEPLNPAPEPFPISENTPTRDEGSPEAGIPEFGTSKSQSRGLLWAGLGLLVVLGLGAAWLKLRPGQDSGSKTDPSPGAIVQKPGKSTTAVVPDAPVPPGSGKEGKATKEAVPPPAIVRAPPPGALQRWASLKDGKLDQALAQGRDHVESLKGNQWTIRLEIACQVETLRNAAGWMEGRSKDIFALAMTMKSGQTCTQLFYGSFPTQAEAEAEIPKLPIQFREGGNKPRVFRVSEIPSRQ